MLMLVLERGVSAEEASLRYTTPLHLAVKAGSKDCVSKLIALGVDVNW